MRPDGLTAPSPRLKECGAALLCGGLSRRMGFDKALFLRDEQGRPLLSVLVGELREIFGELVLVTDSRAKLAAVPGLAGVKQAEDIQPRSGPVGALYTALRALPGRAVFVTACDRPALDRVLIGRLWNLLEAEAAQAALPRYEGRREPLYAFYRPETEPVFRASLAAGRLAVRDSLDRLSAVYLDLSRAEAESDTFKNFNTREDVLRAGLPIPQLLPGQGTGESETERSDCF